jgi:hypothetical protein
VGACLFLYLKTITHICERLSVLLLYLKYVSHICERLPGLWRHTARHNLHGLGQEADLTGNVQRVVYLGKEIIL